MSRLTNSAKPARKSDRIIIPGVRIGSIPDGAYFPFGAGVHKCIGNIFAQMESRIILAAMVQRFAISAIPGHKVRKTLGLVMAPVGGFPVMLSARKTGLMRSA